MKKNIFKLAVFILSIFLITGCDSKYELTPSEAVAWTTLRYAIAQSRLYGGSTSFMGKHMSELKNVVKKFNSNAEWFGRDEIYIGYGKTIDTDKYQITKLCDGNYCATFKIEKNDGDYFLIEYTFDSSNEKENEIWITW